MVVVGSCVECELPQDIAQKTAGVQSKQQTMNQAAKHVTVTVA
jgi:hypothetical protein